MSYLTANHNARYRLSTIRPRPKVKRDIDKLRVVRRQDGWALLVDDIEEPAWVVSRKSRAVEAATDAARFHHATLIVTTRDGTEQRRTSY
jgi:hypothetical protein